MPTLWRIFLRHSFRKRSHFKGISLRHFATKQQTKDIGGFIGLPFAENGKVVVRFPPEPSGYLHIGHAKAVILNQHYQRTYKGKLIVRFDDTNPSKEHGHYEQMIKEDLLMLNIVPDRWTHSSDYFELILELCEKLLIERKAYVDDTDAQKMRKEREQRIESKNRNNSVEENLERWSEMKAGSERGQLCCVRMKIDMKSKNGALLDPTIYRCKPEEHLRTGHKYKVYPTYDFCCPIVDSVEGVTHALRSMEYVEYAQQYYFICDALGLRKPFLWEFSRLNMRHTVLSKRKLAKLVEESVVEGWDDPRMPTIRGVLRRGLTVEGLRKFIIAGGTSRSSTVCPNWEKIWTFNRRVLDSTAPRYTVLEMCSGHQSSLSKATNNLVPVKIRQKVNAETRAIDLHPTDPSVGTKDVWFSQNLFVEQLDAAAIKDGDIVSFINWGNVRIGEVKRDAHAVSSIVADLDLENKDYKKTLKVTWLAEAPNSKNIPIRSLHYDHLITKPIVTNNDNVMEYVNKESVIEKRMLGEPALANVRKGEIVQFQRKGFFICDKANDVEFVFISIP